MEDKTIIKGSSMRLALIWGMILLSLIIIGVAYRIATTEVVDYTGIAYLLGGAAVFIGALVTGKYFQKKEEVKAIKDSEEYKGGQS